MKTFEFRISKSLCANSGFLDASADELRVLVALIQQNGRSTSIRIAELAGVSEARCLSSVAFWRELGVLADLEPTEGRGNVIVREFDERVYDDELHDMSGLEVAAGIRDEALSDLFEECARLMNKGALSAMETKRITELSIQMALPAEYIASLAAHMSAEGGLSTHRLISRAMRYCELGIDTVEKLEEKLASDERERGDFAELKRVFELGRAFSKSEKEYLHKWLYDFGFGIPVIYKAYDIAVSNTNHGVFAYMNAILQDWHGAGCKTLEDCSNRSEEYKKNIQEQFEKKTSSKSKKKPTPRYGDFDPEEALKMALERSFPGFEDSDVK